MNAFGIPALDDPALVVFVSLFVKSVLILLPALGIHLFFRRMSASAKSHLWTVTIIALLLAPLLSLILPAWRPPAERWFASPANGESAQWEVRYFDPEDASRLLVERADEKLALSRPEANPASIKASRDSFNWKRFVKPDVLITNLARTWLAGVLLLLSALLVSILRVVRLNRASKEIQDDEWIKLLRRVREELDVRRNVRLVLAPSSTIPMTWDLFNAVIFLPPESNHWTLEKRAAVLRHELAHVRRRDCLIQLLAGIVSAIYLMNPLVWIAARALRLEQEKACDDLVVTSGSEAENYAGQLVQIAREFRPVSAARFTAITMARRSQLEKRLKAILDHKRRRRPIGRRMQTVFFLGACLAAAAIATIDLGAQEQSATQSTETLADESPEQAANDPVDIEVEKQNSESPNTPAEEPNSEPEVDLRKEAISGMPGRIVFPSEQEGASGRKAIYEKLHQIVLPEVLFDSIPLNVVVRYLKEESRKRDPEGQGINFLINPFVYSSSFATESTETSNTDATTPLRAIENVDLSNVTIRINPALNNVRLADVLDAVVKVADQPIKFSVEDYAVVFSPKLPEQRELITRTYRVDPEIFSHAVQKMAVSLDGATNKTLVVQEKVRAFFKATGVSLQPPNAIFYNDQMGLLLIRATSQELDIVEQALQVLDAKPPQVHLQVKIVEMTPEFSRKAGFDWLPDNPTKGPNNTSFPPTPIQVAESIYGILTPQQFDIVIRRIKENEEAAIVGEPQVITLSGLTAQVSVSKQKRLLVMDENADEETAPRRAEVTVGPAVTILPRVAADGYTIQLIVLASLTDLFPGGERETSDAAQSQPILSLKTFQANYSVTLRDGQTMVTDGIQYKDLDGTEKLLVIFVKPTIMDPAGNRVNDPDNLPFDPNTVPPQQPTTPPDE